MAGDGSPAAVAKMQATKGQRRRSDERKYGKAVVRQTYSDKNRESAARGVATRQRRAATRAAVDVRSKAVARSYRRSEARKAALAAPKRRSASARASNRRRRAA